MDERQRDNLSKATLADVAKHAGVSAMTVSRALRSMSRTPSVDADMARAHHVFAHRWVLLMNNNEAWKNAHVGPLT